MRSVLIGIILLLTGFLLGVIVRPPGTGTMTDTTYVYDTVIYDIYDTVPYPVPVPVQVVENITHDYYDTITFYDTIPVAVSTDDIIADYYRLRTYNDVIADDNLEFHIREQVGANRIINRSTSYRMLRPDKVITKYPQSVYVGGIVYQDGIAPMVTFSDKNYYLTAGFDPFNKRAIVGGGVKLWQSK